LGTAKMALAKAKENLKALWYFCKFWITLDLE
jgi:hypothetical protein